MKLYCKMIAGALTALAVHSEADAPAPEVYGPDVLALPYPGEIASASALLGKPVEAPDLGAVKAALKARVDVRAESLRQRLVTPGSGQAMEYQEAQAQAAAALKAPASATAAKYPMLAASIGIDFDPATGTPAADVLGVARSVVAAYESWLVLGAAIRAARLTGKATIEAAASLEAAAEAFAAIEWPAAPAS